MIAADRAVSLAYQRLSGDSTFSTFNGGRISREPGVPVAVGAARFPYTTLGLQADGPPLMTLDATRVKEQPVIRASMWATTAHGWETLHQMSDRADTLLHGYRGVWDGVTMGKFVRIDHIDMVEEEVDGTYLHCVLLFRVEVHT